MLTAQYPVTGDQNLRSKSGRKPLQPKNSTSNQLTETTPNTKPKPKPKQEWIEISLIGDSNKENYPTNIFATTPIKIEPLDSSLAEELSAIKKKLERLRLDKDRTEKMLKEKDMVLDMQMNELQQRGEIQKQLEIEVDRLYRLNQLKSCSMRISPIRSLREKEQHKKINEPSSSSSQDVKAADLEESVDENEIQSPSPSSVSSKLVTLT